MNDYNRTRECYCCDENLLEVFYCCLACDVAMNIACVKKPPVLCIDHPEWHEHSLALFPRHASLTCNLCGLADSSSPIYMCLLLSHQHHHLRLDDNMVRDYDENKVCQACITPVYFGNFYSCMQCDFILHEECANLSRRIYHPIHPHMLTLRVVENTFVCGASHQYCLTGFFYVCGKKRCDFKLNVQCVITSEPLVHESHMHPLFLTSKPGEEPRTCSVCKERTYVITKETLNCIECDFALCFGCATLPPKVRYKHDKHTLTLSYGDETSTTTYWCEACEGKVDPKQRFYVCDEYCCVTLHIECLLGRDLYMKPGFSWFYKGSTEKKVHILPNNHHMTRPNCSYCEKRCPHKIAFEWSGSILCSLVCLTNCNSY